MCELRVRGTSGVENSRRTMAVALTLLALLIELTVGYPDRLLRAIGHPVTWIGRLIDRLDRVLNHDGRSRASRRIAGIAALGALIAIVAAIAAALEQVLLLVPFGII